MLIDKRSILQLPYSYLFSHELIPAIFMIVKKSKNPSLNWKVLVEINHAKFNTLD